MIRSHTAALCAVLVMLAAPAANAFYNVEVGGKVADAQMTTVSGKVTHLLPKGASAHLFLFFRPDQDQTLKTLQAISAIHQRLEKKNVSVVAVVSDAYELKKIEDLVKVANLRAPVLIDKGNQLYGKIGVILTPSAGVANAKGELVAYLPFRQVNYELLLESHVKFALGELTEAQLSEIINPKAVTQGGDEAKAKRNLKLGEMLYKSKKYDKAAEIAKKSIEYADSHAASHGLLAACLAHQGDCAGAMPEIEKALSLDAEEKYALEAKAACAAK